MPAVSSKNLQVRAISSLAVEKEMNSLLCRRKPVGIEPALRKKAASTTWGRAQNPRSEFF